MCPLSSSENTHLVFAHTHLPCEALRMQNRIRELRTRKGLSQQDVADAIGLSQQHVERMENMKQRLNTDHMEKLGKLFGVRPLEILEEEGRVRAPILDEVQAGAFVDAAGAIDEREMRGLDDFVLVDYPRRTIFALRVRGDSMDRVVPEGGLVIVDYSTKNLESGELGVFRLADGKATFKRYRRQNGEEWLQPDSENHRHVPIFPEDGQEIEALGRVVIQIQPPRD